MNKVTRAMMSINAMKTRPKAKWLRLPLRLTRNCQVPTSQASSKATTCTRIAQLDCSSGWSDMGILFPKEYSLSTNKDQQCDAALPDEPMPVHPLQCRNPMIYDVVRHEPLQQIEWNVARVELSIRSIVADAEVRFSTDRYWPPHPKDSDGNSAEPLTPLYFGAVGMIWALHHLRDIGA